MVEVDANLVKVIAEQVMAALRGGGGGVVSVHAPLGECTGDYSKFRDVKVEGAPAPVGVGVQPAVAPAAAVSPVQGVVVLTGVITVSQLRAVKGIVRVGKGGMLTPLAQDYIREKRIQVVSEVGGAGGEKVAVNAGGNLATYWWIEGQCPSVAKVVEALRPNVVASRERFAAEGLKGAVKELAGLVKNKRVGGGVLFLNSAARAGCFANRCHSLRAVVGTSDKAVAEGIEQLGANVLILEYPLHGFKSMMAMVKPFVESLHAVPAGVQKELSELMTCG